MDTYIISCVIKTERLSYLWDHTDCIWTPHGTTVGCEKKRKAQKRHFSLPVNHLSKIVLWNSFQQSSVILKNMFGHLWVLTCYIFTLYGLSGGVKSLNYQFFGVLFIPHDVLTVQDGLNFRNHLEVPISYPRSLFSLFSLNYFGLLMVPVVSKSMFAKQFNL